MTTFESPIKTIKAPQKRIFDVLSDLNNIKSHLNNLPDDQVEVLKVEKECVFFKVKHAGEFGLQIIDKEPNKTIKFEAVDSPIKFNLWIQLKEVQPEDVKVKLTLKSDMNPMVKMMIGKSIKDFMNKLIDAIATYDYR